MQRYRPQNCNIQSVVAREIAEWWLGVLSWRALNAKLESFDILLLWWITSNDDFISENGRNYYYYFWRMGWRREVEERKTSGSPDGK